MAQTRVLYIDDEQQLRAKFSNLLRQKGYVVHTAKTGEKGIERLKNRDIDVVFCDLNMPGMNGMEVLGKIKNIDADVPVIILTSHGSISRAVEAMKRGAYHFILKPFEINEIEVTLENAIESRSLKKQIASKEKDLLSVQKQHAEELENRVQERTERLKYSNRQLLTLNEVANQFTSIYDTKTLYQYVPKILVHKFEYDRAFCFVYEENRLGLESWNLKTAPVEAMESDIKALSRDPLKHLPHLKKIIEQPQTIVKEKLPQEKGSSTESRTGFLVATPIIIQGNLTGIIQGELYKKGYERDDSDIARFEMFARMVGLALDNILAYQSLEAKVNRRTESLKKANKELEDKARQLEKSTYNLGRANVDMLAVQEKLEEKNIEMEKLLRRLSQSKDELQAILDTTLNLIVMVDLNGNVTALNRQIKEYFDLDRDKVLQNPFRQFIGHIKEQFESPNHFIALINELEKDLGRNKKRAQSANSFYEHTLRLCKPVPRYLSIFSLPVLDTQQDEKLGSVWMFFDMTERIEAEKTLSTRLRYEEGLAACSQALLKYDDIRIALENALQALLDSTDVSRVYIYKNFNDGKRSLKMKLAAMADAEDVQPYTDEKDLSGFSYKPDFIRWHRLLSSGKAISGPVRSFPEREQKMLSSHQAKSMLILPIFTENEWYGYIGFDDIRKERQWGEEDIRLLRTAAEMIAGAITRRNAEIALQVSEKRFRSLVENAHDIIYSMNPDGTFSYLSPQFEEYTGYSTQSFIGKTFEELMHPDDLEKDIFSPAEAGDQIRELEYRIKHKDGSWRWFVSHSTKILDESGHIIEIIGIAHDVTEIKNVLGDLEATNRELRDTQTQLVQSEKMASLGNLVAGIAHEINTPVGAINSMHNTLIRAVSKLRNHLEEKFTEEFIKDRQLVATLKIIQDANRVIHTGTDRVINMVKRLRSFARLDEAELKDADIHEGIEDTLVLIHHEIKHNIKIVKKFGNIPKIACYPGRLNQVFLNLLINAKQAIEGSGRITIQTYTKDGYVYIAFRDNGVGIAPEHLDKVFDPGFTTKGVGVGTGLGLSICYQIIRDHRGKIVVDSVKGEGTTFTVVIPMDLDKRIQQVTDK